MTIPALAFLLSLNLSTAFADCSCSWGGADGKTLTIKGCSAILYSSCADEKKTANNVIIGTGVTSIGYDAFSWATGLTSITIPEGVTSIGDSAFDNAKSLTSITIPEGVTSIGGHAFGGAKSLTSITIPEGVTYIGGQAFWNASRLKSIIIPDNINTANWNAEVFRDLPEDTYIVCQGDVEKCKNALAKFGGNGNCTVSLCINANKIVAADESQCTSTNHYWSGTSCNNKKNGINCAKNWKQNEDFCNRIQYTPAEAAKVLNDDNTNSVTITFKK